MRAWEHSGGTQNAANETGTISGTGVDWIDPTFDPAGNMISGPKASTGSPSGSNQAELTRLHYIYDAWNRLTYVKNDSGGNPGTTLATYEYDGLNRRIEKTVGANTDESYYNENWQVLEVRRNGDPDAREQYTWDAGYIDTPIFKAYDAAMDGTVDNYYYYMTDANHNVTAIYDSASGQVQERYLYDPYGRVQFYDRIWTKLSSSAKDNSILYGGYVFDAETNNYYARNRYLQPTMGKWTQRDFAGYVDGANLFQYVDSNPLRYVDWIGLCNCTPPVAPFPNEYKRKVQGIHTTVIGVDPAKEQAVEKWIEGAEQIELIKTFGDLAGSGLKGAYGEGAKGAAKGGAKQAAEGGVKGAAKEMIKDRVQSKVEDKLNDLAKGGVETDADAKILAVRNLVLV